MNRNYTYIYIYRSNPKLETLDLVSLNYSLITCI